MLENPRGIPKPFWQISEEERLAKTPVYIKLQESRPTSKEVAVQQLKDKAMGNRENQLETQLDSISRHFSSSKEIGRKGVIRLINKVIGIKP